MYFIRYCRLTVAVHKHTAINEEIPRTVLLSVLSYLRATELQWYLRGRRGKFGVKASVNGLGVAA
jgi:hypothetical protein